MFKIVKSHRPLAAGRLLFIVVMLLLLLDLRAVVVDVATSKSRLSDYCVIAIRGDGARLRP